MGWDSIRAGGAAYQVQEKRAREISGVLTLAEEGYKGIRPAYVVWTSIDDVTRDSEVLENFTGADLNDYELRGFIRISYKGHECWGRIRKRTTQEAYHLGDYELITEGFSIAAILSYGGKPLNNTDFNYLDAETQSSLIKALKHKTEKSITVG